MKSLNNNRDNSSKRRRRFHFPFFDAFESSQVKQNINKICLICEEHLTNEELNNNILECNDIFCDYCYFNYFKEKINNNQVEKIKCPNEDCDYIIFNNFIENKIYNDISLLEKYKKLRKRKQLMLDPNIQLCPFPDCESYAKKRKNEIC